MSLPNCCCTLLAIRLQLNVVESPQVLAFSGLLNRSCDFPALPGIAYLTRSLGHNSLYLSIVFPSQLIKSVTLCVAVS